jgi:hypothetical protein
VFLKSLQELSLKKLYPYVTTKIFIVSGVMIGSQQELLYVGAIFLQQLWVSLGSTEALWV